MKIGLLTQNTQYTITKAINNVTLQSRVTYGLLSAVRTFLISLKNSRSLYSTGFFCSPMLFDLEVGVGSYFQRDQHMIN